jgi:hypothetical protein
MKSCKNGKSGRKRFLELMSGRKRACIFLAREIAKNVGEKSNTGKEKQKGLIVKINANNLCQRKLF